MDFLNRYLKRGINEKGRVANDVETEQIVFEDVPGKVPTQITSVVQNRGSIPLFWSQETSRLNIRPDIILQKKDQSYEATRLHFDNLVERYGNPITILNLIKMCEKKPRESLLRAEFAHAIDYINKDLSEENFLRFLHWDLQKDYRRKGTDVLALLCNVAACVLDLTGFFYCLVTPALTIQGASKWPIIAKDNDDDCPCNIYDSRAEGVVKCGNETSEGKMENPDISGRESPADESKRDGSYLGKLSIFQKGVLRTNCIDCLDRTNVAQYAYGLVALGHQLCSLGFIDVPRIDLDAPLADDLMAFYERMGDTLALQYGGSAAHNKIFSERRGQWKAATQSQELLRTLQRYYSNMYMDAEKQDAINVFLGHFQPQQGKPALWELDSDQHYNVGRLGRANARSFINRSQSDGIILCESSTPLSTCSVEQKELLNSALPPRMHKHRIGKRLCDSMPQISTCESNMPYSGYTPVMSHRQRSVDDSGHVYFTEHRLDESNFSNFLDLDWFSSFGNLCEEETSKRSAPANSSMENLSTDNVMNGVNTETSSTQEGPGVKGREKTNRTLTIDPAGSSSISNEFTDSFVQWVANGGTFCY